MKKKQIITAVSISAGAAVCIFLLIAGLRVSRTLKIGFYEVPASVMTVLQTAVTDILKKNTILMPVSFKILDNSKPLSYNGTPPKADIIFTVSGENFNTAAYSARKVPAAAVSSVTEPIKNTVRVNNGYTAAPLLADHFEAAYSKPLLSELRSAIPSNTAAIETLAARAKDRVRWPIVCAGGDDYVFSMFISAVTESYGGYSGWMNVVRALKSGKELKDVLSVQINSGGETFADAIGMLISWRSKGLLHPQWYDFNLSDIASFVDSQTTCIIFMPLSHHRTFKTQDISPYTESFFPGKTFLQDKTVTAPLYSGLIFSDEGSVKEKNAQIILTALASADNQKMLAEKTGLAPLHATAKAPDRQASDVRYWTAASVLPIQGIAEASFSRKSDQRRILNELRNYIKNSGKLDL